MFHTIVRFPQMVMKSWRDVLKIDTTKLTHEMEVVMCSHCRIFTTAIVFRRIDTLAKQVGRIYTEAGAASRTETESSRRVPERLGMVFV